MGFLAADVIPVDPSAWSSVMTALTSQLSVTTVIGVIASVVAAGVGLVFAWWGVRKASFALMAAFKNGKLKV